MRLIAEFNFYLREHPVGELFHAPLDIVFSQYDVVEPDCCTSATNVATSSLRRTFRVRPTCSSKSSPNRIANTTKSRSALSTNARTSASTGSSIRVETRFRSSGATRQDVTRSPRIYRGTRR
jgi:hypothetical protein